MFRSKGLDIINGVSSQGTDVVTMIGHIGNLHDYMTIYHTQFRDAKNDCEVGIWLLATKQRPRLKPNSIFGLNSEAEVEC